jgi:hypothetical protein
MHRRMVREAVRNAVPAQRKKTERPAVKMAAAAALIDAILESDRKAPQKQRHTARRIFDRIRAEVPGCTPAERTVRQNLATEALPSIGALMDLAAAPRASVPEAGRFVMRLVEELQPHPDFAKHRGGPPIQSISVLSERGEVVFQEPITITQDGLIVKGYGRLVGQMRATRPFCLRRGPQFGNPHPKWLLRRYLINN